MFANLLQYLNRRMPEDYDLAFVEEVRVHDSDARDPRVERIILVCWILIAVKHLAVIYACHRWPIPFNALWVNAPTWMLGVLATGVYYRRHGWSRDSAIEHHELQVR